MRVFEGSATLIKHVDPATRRFEEPPAICDSVRVIRRHGSVGDELQVDMAAGTRRFVGVMTAYEPDTFHGTLTVDSGPGHVQLNCVRWHPHPKRLLVVGRWPESGDLFTCYMHLDERDAE